MRRLTRPSASTIASRAASIVTAGATNACASLTSSPMLSASPYAVRPRVVRNWCLASAATPAAAIPLVVAVLRTITSPSPPSVVPTVTLVRGPMYAIARLRHVALRDRAGDRDLAPAPAGAVREHEQLRRRARDHVEVVGGDRHVLRERRRLGEQAVAGERAAKTGVFAEDEAAGRCRHERRVLRAHQDARRIEQRDVADERLDGVLDRVERDLAPRGRSRTPAPLALLSPPPAARVERRSRRRPQRRSTPRQREVASIRISSAASNRAGVRAGAVAAQRLRRVADDRPRAAAGDLLVAGSSSTSSQAHALTCSDELLERARQRLAGAGGGLSNSGAKSCSVRGCARSSGRRRSPTAVPVPAAEAHRPR